MSGYLAAHRKSAIAAVGLVVTFTPEQVLPHWSGTAAVTAAAGLATWALVHWIPNIPSSSIPDPSSGKSSSSAPSSPTTPAT